MNDHHHPLKLASPEDWQPFDDVYRDFADANPMLGLHTSEWASTRLRQQYGDALEAAGAAMRLPNRKWLASPRLFGPVLFRAMALRRQEILARTGEAVPPGRDQASTNEVSHG